MASLSSRLGLVLAAFAVGACGSRTALDGGDGNLDPSRDASSLMDVGSSTDGRGAGARDASPDVACTPMKVNVGMGGPTTCKFGVEWTCGDTTFRFGGGCGITTPDPSALYYEGGCFIDEQPTSTVNVATTSCDCKDLDALAKFVQVHCQSQ